MVIHTLILGASLATAQDPGPCAALPEAAEPLLVVQCGMDAEEGFAAATRDGSVKAFRAFRAAHPASTHIEAAIEAEAEAALKDVQDMDTPEAWRALRAHYPVHAQLAQEREIKAVAKLIGEGAELDLPCETPEPTEETKKPKPTCTTIEAEAVIRASWTTPEGYHARPRLVGWDGTKAINLAGLQRKIGAAPYATEYAAIVQASKGGMDETGWRVELPVALKLPPGQGLVGYAVELQVMGQGAKLLPFYVTEEWADTRVRTR
jgi:hypothetical protein